MTKLRKVLAYISFFMLVLITIFPAIIVIYSNEISIELISICTVLIISLVILLINISRDIKFFRNVIINIIFNITLIITPGIIGYIISVYIPQLVNNKNIEVSMNYILTGSTISWIGPSLGLNIINIIISICIYFYQNKSENE